MVKRASPQEGQTNDSIGEIFESRSPPGILFESPHTLLPDNVLVAGGDCSFTYTAVASFRMGSAVVTVAVPSGTTGQRSGGRRGCS